MKTAFKPIYLITVALALSLSFIISSCKQTELGDVGFPRVRTLHVEMITDTGALFKGEILDIPADCEILDHGFCWSEYPGVTAYYDKVSLGSTKSTGVFQGSADRAMVAGKKYYFKSYVQTPTLTIYGNEIEFVSLGSHAPVITSITPHSGCWRDTIIIHGKYFTDKTYNIQVYFGTALGTNISSSSTEIKTLVPMDLDTSQCKLSLKYSNVMYPSDKVFTLDPHVLIKSIEPISGSWNSVIKIRGENLKFAQAALFNDISTNFKSISDSMLEVVVPTGVTSLSSNIYVKINSYKFSTSQKFTLLPGKIKSISQESGTVGSQLILKTTNVRTAVAKVYFNETEVQTNFRTDTTIVVTVPYFQKSGQYEVRIIDGPFEIKSETLFNYKIPEIIAKSPESSTIADTLTLTGKNFNLFSNYTVKIGENICNVLFKDDNNIKIIIPNSLNFYEYEVSLTCGNYKFLSPFRYRRANPVIENVEKVVENGTEYLIIKGIYFGPLNNGYSSNFYFTIPENNYYLSIVTSSNKEIKCRLPGLLNGSYSVKLTYNYYNFSVQKNNAFSINGPFSEYYSLANASFDGGKFIKNDENSLYISTYYKDFLFDLNLKTTVEIPKFLPYSNLMVKNNRDVIYLNSSDQFMKKTNLDDKTTTSYSKFTGRLSNYATGGAYNGKIYFLGCNPNNTYYDFNYLHEFNGNWVTVTNLTYTDSPYNLFEYNGEFYIIGYSRGWKLSNNQLSSLLLDGFSFYPYLFSIINNKAYFSIGDAAYEYNLTSNSWKKLCLIPNNTKPSFFVTKNGKGYYAEIYNNTFKIIEFDPSKIN